MLFLTKITLGCNSRHDILPVEFYYFYFEFVSQVKHYIPTKFIFPFTTNVFRSRNPSKSHPPLQKYSKQSFQIQAHATREKLIVRSAVSSTKEAFACELIRDAKILSPNSRLAVLVIRTHANWMRQRNLGPCLLLHSGFLLPANCHGSKKTGKKGQSRE